MICPHADHDGSLPVIITIIIVNITGPALTIYYIIIIYSIHTHNQSHNYSIAWVALGGNGGVPPPTAGITGIYIDRYTYSANKHR